ncbi:MAG: substrate-binding domain-containing protein [Fimbriimonadales bacterium]|nr:substrate-binding domain-containing protein [Fimbriimonadales bacterium]
MKAPTYLCPVLALGLLSGCGESRRPHPEQFRYPIGVYIQSTPNDFWQAVEAGLRKRLSLPGVELTVKYFTKGERAQIAKEMSEGEWRALALCAPPDEWANQTIQQAMGNGIPLLCVATDAPDSVRAGFVGTYYYDAGRKAGAWYARRLSRGVVVVIAGHPTPRAASEFWEGFRHGLLFNRRVRARLVSLSDSRRATEAFRRVQGDPAVQGIFLMGAEVAAQTLQALEGKPRPARLGILSWRTEAEQWYLNGRCDVLIREQPEQIGERLGNLLRDHSAGRGKPQTVFVPYLWRAR